MSNFKHVLNFNGYWLAISTSGSIKLNDKWNLNSLPTQYHKWNDELQDFILDEDLKTKSEKENRIIELINLLDKNKQKLIENKVIYTEDDPNFIIYEKKYRQERESLLTELKNSQN
tara:strand:- start:263 stop:610 length:348 start_codon:yes stop_codon:yes gene_type:complete